MDTRDEIACPACSEMILRSAKKCKHCGERLAPHIKDTALQAPAGAEGDIAPREVLFSMSQANFIKKGQFTLLTQDGASLGEVGYRLPPLSVSLFPGRHFLQLRNSFGQVPFPVDVSNEEQPLRVAIFASAGGLQAVYNESADSVRSNNVAVKRALWMNLGIIIACCIPLYAMFKLAYDDSFSIGTSSSSSIPASCRVVMKGSCSVASANSQTVRLSVSGFSGRSTYLNTTPASVQCNAINATGQTIGGDRKSFDFGNVNASVTLDISSNEPVKSVRCAWIAW